MNGKLIPLTVAWARRRSRISVATSGAAGFQHGIERFQPLLNLYVVNVVRLCVRLVIHGSPYSSAIALGEFPFAR